MFGIQNLGSNESVDLLGFQSLFFYNHPNV